MLTGGRAGGSGSGCAGRARRRQAVPAASERARQGRRRVPTRSAQVAADQGEPGADTRGGSCDLRRWREEESDVALPGHRCSPPLGEVFPTQALFFHVALQSGVALSQRAALALSPSDAPFRPALVLVLPPLHHRSPHLQPLSHHVRPYPQRLRASLSSLSSPTSRRRRRRVSPVLIRSVLSATPPRPASRSRPLQNKDLYVPLAQADPEIQALVDREVSLRHLLPLRCRVKSSARLVVAIAHPGRAAKLQDGCIGCRRAVGEPAGRSRGACAETTQLGSPARSSPRNPCGALPAGQELDVEYRYMSSVCAGRKVHGSSEERCRRPTRGARRRAEQLPQLQVPPLTLALAPADLPPVPRS